MGKRATTETTITPQALKKYLESMGKKDVEILRVHPLGQDTQEGLKAYGYGRPLAVHFRSGQHEESWVIRTMSPDPFGHERRADRAQAIFLAFDTFARFPRHIQPLAIGTFDGNNDLIPMASGEPFFVTQYVDGELYAHDLHEMQKLEKARPLDLKRAEAMGIYQAELHHNKVSTQLYARCLRDTLGAGEGIFGQLDSYPSDHPTITPQRLQKMEHLCSTWRWKLKSKATRACQTHGDFHPFNILFREENDFSMLDCSRGGIGEAADDVSCLTLNYLFFSLAERNNFSGALKTCWELFWKTYIDKTSDTEIYNVIPLFYAWRILVVANPMWYPNLDAGIRETLFLFAEKLLRGEPFDPMRINSYLELS